MDFAQTLKSIMENKSVTMYRLAKDIHVHPTTVKNWLDGKSEPRISELEAIAGALDTHILDLMGVGEKLDKYQTEALHPQSEQVQEVLSEDVRDTYDALSKEEQAEFWKILQQSNHLQSALLNAYGRLNAKGQQTAVERVEELTEIPRYQRREPQAAPESEGSPDDKK